ncbi:uncharacterized protein LOC108167118 isoform X1 [Poecilia reticulata]|uniref:uncharacterized protein LOC108167118 isoform X1 n=1 Tax=Poecilia reticulata TaxID=8081 RepID=UPI0007EB97DC|nr:PREDICTED: uncharacterized protein LOC108167118 isoform X1 [Poecilia reticulata]
MKCRIFSPVMKGLWTKTQQFTSFSPSPGQSDSLGAQMKSLSLLLLLNLFFSGQIQGSTEMIQMFLPTGKESTISLPIDKLPENSTVLWLDHLNRTIAIYYPNGETKVEPPFEGKVKISGPTSLMFLSPQNSDSGFYFVKVIRDQIQTIKFNITFQDQNTDTTDASPVSPAVSPAVLAVLVLAIIAAAAAAAVVLWRYLKKKRQDQKGAVLFSANSGTNSPTVRILLPPPQCI